MRFAPIAIFAFNRPDHLKQTIKSLLQNPESAESELYVFVDGPRQSVPSDKRKVEAVRNTVLEIKGFKTVHNKFSHDNLGLAGSIISGVTEVLKKHGRIIVIEDDLFLSRSFLRYMNEMLEKFQNEDRVMQVSGWGAHLRVKCPYDAYLNGRSMSWTWGTWTDRWETVDWEVTDFDELSKSKAQQRAFCEHGSDIYGMLRGYMMHQNNSWYVRFAYSMHKQGRYCITPVRSLVRNDGFDSTATHCDAYNRYKTDFEIEHQGTFNIPLDITPDKKLMKDAVFYWSVRMRLFGKLMTFIKRHL